MDTWICGAIVYFNPLAPRGARHFWRDHLLPYPKFQSTSSSRSQTFFYFNCDITHVYFNPLAPHGARLVSGFSFLWILRFQSTSSSRSQTPDLLIRVTDHTLFQSTSSSRSQTRLSTPYKNCLEFQSTSSSRSQTDAARTEKETVVISIH